jgi:radical SAM superfamily enzyme YgiQ (UPF0313 family)
MKKIGIITLTRRMTLAYAALKQIVENSGDTPVCGEAIGSEGIYFPLEELSRVGHDFLLRFFEQAGFSDLDIILISAPYTVNWFHLPKVMGCLRRLNTGPIIVGGNEPSNNYKNLMIYRYAADVNAVVDIAPDFIVRGSAEKVLSDLLLLLDKTVMQKKWNQDFLKKLFDIPNLVFWLPKRMALISTPFSSEALSERDVFTYVKYGEQSIAITLQRACVWTKKSGGGCLFCAIASQFGKDFHCAVQSDFFLEDLGAFLRKSPEIKYVDIWDDTFNINANWVIKICDYLNDLTRNVGRELIYSCFLRPKGLDATLAQKMGATRFKVAFVGADALTEELARRLRRGCTISELNKSIETLSQAGIQPRLSVQLFSPESTIDDVGITATLTLNCIKNGESTAHVHLYTFPLFGSDIYKLLAARSNLKKIPSPLIKRSGHDGFEPHMVAYDYLNYDPDVEAIKQQTYRLLDVSASFFVRTYPGDNVDGKKLKTVVKEVRKWSAEAKKSHKIKSVWYMIVLLREDQGQGMDKEALLNYLSANDSVAQIPEYLRKNYANFGYAYTLSRSFNEVMAILINNDWVQKFQNKSYRLTFRGLKGLQTVVREGKDDYFNVAAYGKIDKLELLEILENKITG